MVSFAEPLISLNMGFGMRYVVLVPGLIDHPRFVPGPGIHDGHGIEPLVLLSKDNKQQDTKTKAVMPDPRRMMYLAVCAYIYFSCFCERKQSMGKNEEENNSTGLPAYQALHELGLVLEIWCQFSSSLVVLHDAINLAFHILEVALVVKIFLV